jgi:hypothetical protein
MMIFKLKIQADLDKLIKNSIKIKIKILKA